MRWKAIMRTNNETHAQAMIETYYTINRIPSAA
jgi:hypothetical protein